MKITVWNVMTSTMTLSEFGTEPVLIRCQSIHQQAVTQVATCKQCVLQRERSWLRKGSSYTQQTSSRLLNNVINVTIPENIQEFHPRRFVRKSVLQQHITVIFFHSEFLQLLHTQTDRQEASYVRPSTLICVPIRHRNHSESVNKVKFIKTFSLCN